MLKYASDMLLICRNMQSLCSKYHAICMLSEGPVKVVGPALEEINPKLNPKTASELDELLATEVGNLACTCALPNVL